MIDGHKRKSIWIPRIPRTASTYVITKLRNAAIEQNWKLLKKDQSFTSLESDLQDYNCIYTGHNSFYSDRIKDWTKLLVVRQDVIGRFVSCYNYSNHLLDLNEKELLDLDTFINFHLDWESEESKQLVQKNEGLWNPFTDTESYLNFIQTTHKQPLIDDIFEFFDKIYFTNSVDQLLSDLENVYGYNLDYKSDWNHDATIIKNSGLDLPNINPTKVTDLTNEQFHKIMNTNVVQKEYKFLEILLSKQK